MLSLYYSFIYVTFYRVYYYINIIVLCTHSLCRCTFPHFITH